MHKLLILLLLVGCAKDPNGPSQHLGNFEVSNLFEHEGCTVYRFYDTSRYRYYTNCKGTSMSTSSCGKNCTNHDTIETHITD